MYEKECGNEIVGWGADEWKSNVNTMLTAIVA